MGQGHRGDFPTPLHHRAEVLFGVCFVAALVGLHAVLIRRVIARRAVEKKLGYGHHLP